jgi:two-component system, sensor histidine kinase
MKPLMPGARATRQVLQVVDPWAAHESSRGSGPEAAGEELARGHLRALEKPDLRTLRSAVPALLVLLLPLSLALSLGIALLPGPVADGGSAVLAGATTRPPAWLALTPLLPMLLLWLLLQQGSRHRLRIARWMARLTRGREAGLRVVAWCSALCLLLPALLAGWAAAGAAVPLQLIAVACTLLLALAGAVLLAPVTALAGLAAALPLVMLLSWAVLAAQPLPQPGVLAACAVLSALTAAWLAVVRRREWRHAQRERLGLQDRIKSAELEAHAARRSEEDKTRFLAIASHDLRQPVHAVGLFAAALDKRLQGTPDEYLVRNVMRAIDGLDRSFTAMLDISRLDAGSIEPNIQHFSLRDLFRRLHMQFAGQAEVAGLNLRLSPGGKSVSSDPQLLERVLGNLVQNALKYTEHGGVVVVARSTATHINVEVWDTGAGIPASELPLIFNEFYQIGHGERDRTRGLGMGLAIVKRLVALLGHSLTVATREGSGTMFRIGIAHGGLPGIGEAITASDTLPMPVPLAQMILVVDDEAAIRDGLRILLEEWGCHVIAAGSADEAEQTVRALRAPIDLIISDLHLGEGPDGLVVIERVRNVCGYEVPAMVVTGDTSPQEMRRLSDSGHVVLFKPVQPRKLFSMLRSFGS